MAATEAAWDVAVAGAGMAGLSAALAAAERGARVVVLEKAARPGGNANLAAGVFLGAEDVAGLHAYIPDGDPVLQRLMCDGYASGIAWLEAHGLPIGPNFRFADYRRGRTMALGVPGDRAPFMARLAEAAARAGATIRYGAALAGLRRDGDGFAVATADGGTVAARSVVLATGGFQGSRDLLTRYLGAGPAAALLLRTVPECTGDGLTAALALGAATGGDMTAFYGHTMADGPIAPNEFQPMTPYFARLGVLLNRDGRRFVDEGSSHLEEVNPQAGCRQPGGVYHLVFDARIYRPDAVGGGTDRAVPNPRWMARARELDLPILEAPTLDGLVARLAEAEGLPAGATARTLAAYNRACAEDALGGLDPPRSGEAIPVAAPPFYAMRCIAGATATCGGIAIDGDGRVLAAGGAPIPGLFAAGVDAGGVYGRTYGGFLAWALTSGRRSGESAAARSAG